MLEDEIRGEATRTLALNRTSEWPFHHVKLLPGRVLAAMDVIVATRKWIDSGGFFAGDIVNALAVWDALENALGDKHGAS